MDNDNNCWDNVNVLQINEVDNEETISKEDQIKCKTFEVKNYTPRRTYEKYFKPLYIAIIIMIASIIIIITTVSAYATAKVDDKRHKPSDYIILLDDKGLWIFDPKIGEFTLLHEMQSDVFFMDPAGIIFWSKMAKIMSFNKHQNLSSFLFEESRLRPQGMAFDFIGENLYVVDEAMGALVVISTRDKQPTQNEYFYNILLTGLEKPRDILLDPLEGLMFILQSTNFILRGNMDSRFLKKIVPNENQPVEILAIAIDCRDKRVYWIENHVIVKSSNYNGTEVTLVVSDSMDILTLAVMNNQVFWLWPAYGRSTNSKLWSCRINENGTCGRHIEQSIDSLRNPKIMKASSFANRNVLSNSTHCRVNKGDCQDLCLVIPDGGRRCACHLGWQLNSDGLTCRDASDFVLYPQGKFVRASILDNSGMVSSDVIWPTEYITEPLKSKEVIDFDYDFINDDFYYSTDTNIHVMKLKGNQRRENQKILLSSSQDFVIEDLAYDWSTGNLYYSLFSKMSSKKHLLMVINVERSDLTKTIISFRYYSHFGLKACPYAMVVHPSRGYLFFTAGENDVRSLYRTTMNGTKLSTITNVPFIHEFRLLAVDYDKDRLYWIADDISGTIKHAAFDGKDVKIVKVDFIKHPKTIYVHRQWLFISNQTSIYRVHKETGMNAMRIAPTSKDDIDQQIAGVRIISHSIQSTNDRDNFCTIKNGDCDQFCFSGPIGTCGCADMYTSIQNHCVHYLDA